MLNKLHLLSTLRKLLRRPDTRIIQKRLRICGASSWEIEDGRPGRITIYLDPRRDGRVRLVIHELLHIWLHEVLGIEGLTYELEEAAVRAWEDRLYAYLHDPKRAADLESWDQAIQRKMT